MSNQPQKSGVSQAAKNFFAKNAAQVEEARNAENMMQSTILPLGYKGKAIVVNAFSEEIKQKKDKDGKLSEPGVIVVIELSVVNDEAHQGTKAKKTYYIQNQGKATWQSKLEWMLNEFENEFGITREERKMELEQIFEILKGEKVYDIEVVEGWNKRKETKVSTGETVDATGSSSMSAAPTAFTVGQKVLFMDVPATVEEVIDAENIKIKTQTGNIRTVPVSQVQVP